jgi:hypothetical protein
MSDVCSPDPQHRQPAEPDVWFDREAQQQGRNAVLIGMLVACLDADMSGGLPGGKVIARLRDRMDRAPGGRGAFGGGGDFAPFRELAWDAALRLLADKNGVHDGRWIKILREILRQLPECDALAE